MSYISPISDDMNVRFVENSIIINKRHDVVHDFVTNWANLGKWFPVCNSTKVLKGKSNSPSQLGDILWEDIKDDASPDPAMLRPKYYTVVAHVPGYLWCIAGQDVLDGQPEGKIRFVVVLTATPLQDDVTKFTRVFQHIRVDGDVWGPKLKVLDPTDIQKNLELLKDAIEKNNET